MIRNINLILKRMFDIVFSLVCLVLLSPFLIIGVMGILLTMPGPIFFKQKRIGKFGKEFCILKLRTMKVDKELENKRDMTHDKERLTSWGIFLRRFKIDELPQLINVLKGDMSLVGPRPTVKAQVDLYSEKEMHRLDMRPGMTGLAQTNGNITLVWEDRILYDLQYVNNFSMLLDFKILVRTIKVVLFGEEKYRNPLSEMNREDSKFVRR